MLRMRSGTGCSDLHDSAAVKDRPRVMPTCMKAGRSANIADFPLPGNSFCLQGLMQSRHQVVPAANTGQAPCSQHHLHSDSKMSMLPAIGQL